MVFNCTCTGVTKVSFGNANGNLLPKRIELLFKNPIKYRENSEIYRG